METEPIVTYEQFKSILAKGYIYIKPGPWNRTPRMIRVMVGQLGLPPIIVWVKESQWKKYTSDCRKEEARR